jgi:hypothetical protein
MRTPSRSLRLTLILAFAASGGVAGPASALQREPGEQAASARGRWLPRDARPISNVTPAQRAEAMAVLEKIERIVRQVPAVANPDGYEFLPIISGGTRHDGPGFDAAPVRGSVVEYRFALMAFRPTRRIAGEGAVCLSVTVNSRQSGSLRDAEGRLIYIEGDRGKPSTNPNISDSRVPKTATQVYGELWNVPGERSMATALFVTAGEMPWKPVSREEYYRAVLFDAEGANGEKLAALREGLKKTPYQEWMDGAAQRKKDRDEALAQSKGILPAVEIEKSRQAQEATEREVTENLKKQEATDRERNADAHAKSFAMRDSMNAELARMTPEERRMPTYINGALDSGPVASGWRLTADESPPAWRVLTPNYDFWRARRAPVEVRTITVHLSMTLTCLAPKIQQALWKAYHELDWAAINDLLEAPR